MSKPSLSATDFTAVHLKKAQVNRAGGVDPKAQAEYEKVFNDCGGNYDNIKAKLGIEWAPRAILPKTAKDFAVSFLQGRLTKD